MSENENVNNGNESSNSVFPQKWMKKLPEGWSSVAEAYSEEELRKCIVECEQISIFTTRDMENDMELAGLKEQLKDKVSVYKDAINVVNAKIKFSIFILENRGKI